jgi:hypothetical protein
MGECPMRGPDRGGDIGDDGNQDMGTFAGDWMDMVRRGSAADGGNEGVSALSVSEAEGRPGRHFRMTGVIPEWGYL